MSASNSHHVPHEEEGEDDGYDTDGSSSAPNSIDHCLDDDQPADIELDNLENDEYLLPIPVILRLCPPTVRGGPPILEVWGARPFGYVGERVIWTTFRAEPDSDDIDDDASFWAPLGIRMNHDEYHRAYLIRPTPVTQDHPPPAPQLVPLGEVPPNVYVDPRYHVQQVPGALLVKTFYWAPEHPMLGNEPKVSTFWLCGCGKVTDKKDLKRIRMKVEVYIEVVKKTKRHYEYPPGTEPTATN